MVTLFRRITCNSFIRRHILQQSRTNKIENSPLEFVYIDKKFYNTFQKVTTLNYLLPFNKILLRNKE